MGQKFTITMLTTVGRWGLGLSAIFASFYLYSLIKSFKPTLFSKKWTEKSQDEKRGAIFQISTLIVYFSWLFYVIVALSGRWFMLSACGIRPALTQTSWVISRAAVYYFFVIRCKTAFEGSMFAFHKWYIWMLVFLITIFYGFSATFYISRSHLMIWFPSMQVCIPSYIFKDNRWHKMGDALIYIQLSCEVFLGLLLVGGYAYKLFRLQQSIDTLGDNEIDRDETSNFLKIAKKQAKLAWIAYISSLFLLYIAGLYVMWSFAPWLDGIINLTCVFCTFAYDHNLWIQYNVCECKGNRKLLYLFCFLCTGCNAAKERAEVTLDLEVNRIPSSDSQGTNKETVSVSPDFDTTADTKPNESDTNTSC